MKDFIDDFGGFILSLACVIVVFVVAVESYAGWQCSNFEKVTGRETQRIKFDACYVKQGDDWIRYDSNYKH